MKYKCVLNTLGEISEKLDELVHGYGELGDNFLYYGKIFNNSEECIKSVGLEEKEVWTSEGIKKKVHRLKTPKEYSRDFRDSNVDDIIVEIGRNYIVNKIIEFCQMNKDGDLQSLLIACAMNIYYTSGLFDRCGILSVSLFNGVLVDKVTEEYVSLIEKLILSSVGKYFYSLCHNHSLFTDIIVEQYLEEYLKCNDTTKKEYCLAKMLDCINPNLVVAKSFVRSIIKEYKIFNDMAKLDCENLINDMYNTNNNYQYAMLLLTISSIKKWVESKGKDTTFLQYFDQCADEILNIANGIKKPSTLDIAFDDDKKEIVTKHGETFSYFVLGMPYIEYQTITSDDVLDALNNETERKNSKYIKNGLEAFLNCPCIINSELNIMKYAFSLACQCSANEKAKQKALDDKKMIINGFSHTYMGMRATSLYNIATELIKEDEKRFQNFGRKLLYEYSIKKNLSRDVEMLKLRFEDRVDELNLKIKNSVFFDKDDNNVTIRKIISDSLTRCMVTLVHDGKAKNVREGFKDFNLIDIRNSFESDILINEDSDIIEWFNNNVFNLNFKISSSWNKIFFENESYAALLLTDIITELIINIFKYADKTTSITIEFTENAECLLIETQNKIREEISKNFEGGYGLTSEGDAIQVLNELNGHSGDAIEYKICNNLFQVKALMARNIFKI